MADHLRVYIVVFCLIVIGMSAIYLIQTEGKVTLSDYANDAVYRCVVHSEGGFGSHIHLRKGHRFSRHLPALIDPLIMRSTDSFPAFSI